MRRKTRFLVSLLASATFLTPISNMMPFTPAPIICEAAEQSAEALTLQTTVKVIDRYNAVILSISPKELLAAGYSYGDLISVEGPSFRLDSVVLGTNFTDAGSFRFVLCDYLGWQKELSLGAYFVESNSFLKAKAGDPITIRMKKKAGYLKEFQLQQTIKTFERSDYESDAIFANFRMVTTTGIAPGRVYRSSNPLNLEENSARAAYADKFCAENKIQTEINISDSREQVEAAMASKDFHSPYCGDLFRRGKVITLHTDSAPFGNAFEEKMADAMRFMIANDGPYVLHCVEGKDRAGFFILFLEALAGASIEELQDDYMLTYCNYFHLEKDGEAYRTLQRLLVDRTIYMMAHMERYKDILNFDPAEVTLDGIDPQKAALRYAKEGLKLTDEEIQALLARIQ